MIKKHIIAICLFAALWTVGAKAQEFTVGMTPGLTFNDSTDVIKPPKPVERCHLIGVNYSVGWGSLYTVPTVAAIREFSPFGVGITYTYLQDLWGMYSLFGLQTGLRYSREGFSYEDADLKPYMTTFYEVAELPFNTFLHYEIFKGYVRLFVNVGAYFGYRLKVERPYLETEDFAATDWEESDNRFDYGIKAGGGIAIVLSPVEIHIECSYKHSFSPLFDPARDSQYYFNYTYPTQILLTVGLHFQLGRKIFIDDRR